MHNGSAVQKLRHSSNPQPPALRRQASSNTSVLVLKERSPDCILQPPTPGKRWEPALSCSWTGFSFSALGGVASAPGGMVSVREAWPLHWEAGTLLGGVASVLGGVVSALGGVASVPVGVVSEAGVLVSVRGVASALGVVASVRGGVAYPLGAGLCMGKRGLCTSLALTVPVCRVGAL